MPPANRETHTVVIVDPVTGVRTQQVYDRREADIVIRSIAQSWREQGEIVSGSMAAGYTCRRGRVRYDYCPGLVIR